MACKHPEKVKHADKAAAKEALREMYRKGRGNPDYVVYQCESHWHIGHNLSHFKARIRDSIKGGRGKGTLYARNRRTKR